MNYSEIWTHSFSKWTTHGLFISQVFRLKLCESLAKAISCIVLKFLRDRIIRTGDIDHTANVTWSVMWHAHCSSFFRVVGAISLNPEVQFGWNFRIAVMQQYSRPFIEKKCWIVMNYGVIRLHSFSNERPINSLFFVLST